MSVSELSGGDLISSVFSPRVAVLASPGAEALAQKNNLSLVELLRPFAQLRGEASLRDPYNSTVHEVRNLRITFEDFDRVQPEKRVVDNLLNSVVSNNLPKKSCPPVAVDVGHYSLKMHTNPIWFNAFRDSFIKTLPISQHEFTRHFVACLIVVSSSEPNISTQFKNLRQRQQDSQTSPSGSDIWLLPDTMKVNVLLHDVQEGDGNFATETVQEMKRDPNFNGPHCSYLLSINSRRDFEVQEILKSNRKYGPKMVDPWKKFIDQSSMDLSRRNHSSKHAVDPETRPRLYTSSQHPLDGGDHPLKEIQDPLSGTLAEDDSSRSEDDQLHGAYLTSADQDTISTFITEFITRALLPHYEKQIRDLYDHLVSKKTISKSFLSATKKWLGSGKGTSYPSQQSAGAREGDRYYPPEAVELQLRKLGDLVFLFQMYDIAYNIYYQCKNDFQNDSAFLFYAGALEMAVLSQYMLGKPMNLSHIDSAIVQYSNTCKNYDYALRCALLCCDALLTRQMHQEAINNFIKMTTEESDLKSALLLEQAAYCFVNRGSAALGKPRKFAFYMVLSGHRYQKAGQKEHTLRAYDLAYQVFANSNWCYAEDHINLTIGKHSYLVNQLEQSAAAYLKLLTPTSRQNHSQQSSFIADFLMSFTDYMDKSTDHNAQFPPIQIPSINSQSISVFYGGTTAVAPDDSDEVEIEPSLWISLEEQAACHVLNKENVPITWKPCINVLNASTKNNLKPRTVRQEPVTVVIEVVNSLMIQISMENIHLLWRFTPVDESGESPQESVENERDVLEGSKLIKTEVIKEIVVGNLEKRLISLSLVPCVEGEVVVTGIAYSLSGGSTDKFGMPRTSSRNVRVKQDLNIEGPKLNSTLEERVSNARGNDYRLHFLVVPPQPLLSVEFAPLPREMLCGEIQATRVNFCNRGLIAISSIIVSSKCSESFCFGPVEQLQRSEELQQDSAIHLEKVDSVSSILKPGEVLEPGGCLSMAFCVRGKETPGMLSLPILFYYTSATPSKLMPHRVVRQAFHITCRDSVSFSVMKSRNLDQSQQLLISFTNMYNSASSQDEAHRCEVGLSHVVCVSSKWRIRNQKMLEYAPAREGEMFNSVATLDRILEEKGVQVSMLNISCNQLKLFPFKPFLHRFASNSVDESDITIVFAWKAGYVGGDKSALAFGQHHQSLDSTKDSLSQAVITTASGMFCEAPRSLPFTVRFRLDYDRSQRYVMRRGGGGSSFVVAPVSVTLNNCLHTQPLLVQVVCPHAPTSVSVRELEANGVRESFAFWWVSQSTWIFVMPPLSQHKLNLRACFFKAGTYNLNNLSVMVSTRLPSEDESSDGMRRLTRQEAGGGGGDFVKQQCAFATFITVEKEDASSAPPGLPNGSLSDDIPVAAQG